MNGSPWFAYIFFSSFILFFLCSAFLLFIWNFLSALHYLYSRSCLHTWISLNLKMTMLFAWLIAKCCMRIFSFAFGLCHYCVKFFAYFLASFCHSHRVAALFFPFSLFIFFAFDCTLYAQPVFAPSLIHLVYSLLPFAFVYKISSWFSARVTVC